MVRRKPRKPAVREPFGEFSLLCWLPPSNSRDDHDNRTQDFNDSRCPLPRWLRRRDAGKYDAGEQLSPFVTGFFTPSSSSGLLRNTGRRRRARREGSNTDRCRLGTRRRINGVWSGRRGSNGHSGR